MSERLMATRAGTSPETPASQEPEMAICGWCEYAHESEDVLTLRSGERVCTECLDSEYGPRRDGRWPL